jgi:preprotein translocase subunit SecF
MAERSTTRGAVERQDYRFTEIVPHDTHIDFIGLRRYTIFVSGTLILAAIALWVIRGGPNYGVDFAGGTMVHLRFHERHAASEVRTALANGGYTDVQLQDFGGQGTEFLLHLPLIAAGGVGQEAVARKAQSALQEAMGAGSFEMLRSEMVGPKVGKDLRRKAILAVIASTIMMGVYLTARFQLRFGIGAAVALVHDVIITLGALMLLNYEFDLPVIAALLTVIGFSVNDTVIVSDRIRENLRKMRRQSLAAIANASINETLSRTVITTGTAIFVILALYLLGGSVIHGFAYTLLIGFVVGTYSSIFVATPVVLLFEEPEKRRR